MTDARFGLATDLASVTLSTSGSGTWRRFEGGAHRTTPFGSETVTFDKESLEQYLTVESRQGRRTWTWKLDGSARARLLDGGRVGFVDDKTGRVSDVLLGAAKIFDTHGKDVTPSGTRWRLVDRGKAQLLALDVDDAELPVPYVIDPIAYRSGNAGVQNGAGSLALTPTIPSAVREGDFLLAHVAIKSGTATVSDASGSWTLVLLTVGAGSPKVNLYTFRKRATAADSAGSSYQFDISASTAGTAAISAWSGVDNTGTVSSAGAVANSLSITLPAVTANSLRLGVGAISINNGFPATCAAGAGCPRRVTVANAAGVFASGVYDGFAAGGSTILTTGTAERNAGQSISVTADATAPNASVLTFPVSTANYNNTVWDAGCATNGFCGTASDSQSGIASVAISIRQGAGNYWNGASFASASEVMLNTTMAADDVSWSYTFAGASFPADGNYTVRVVSTDNGSNAESPGVSATFKIDRTAPTSGVLALNSVTPAGSAYLSGTTVWYRGVQSGGGSFRLRNTVTDNVGGSGAGGSRTNALVGMASGWTHTASTVATPAGGPYDSNTFTWAQNTSTSPTEIVDALDAATNALALSTLTLSDDSSTNAPTVTFPVDTSSYNTAGWNAGCSTGPGDLCGTSDDSSKSGIAAVDVSIRQGAGNYWNGASFASGAEVWNAATGTTTWSLGFAGSNFPADGTYNFRVRSTDNVGNTAIGTFAITIDTGTPAAPSSLASTPASPANNNDPRITGTAEAGSTVNVYATSDCSGGSVASGTAAAFSSPGLNPTDIADNSTTSYTANATDAAGNQSSCSSSISYVEDSAAPSAPSSLGSTPASPANNNDPRITGTAEAGSTVNVYATSDCSGGSVASGTAAAFGGGGLNPPDIADNSTTPYTARATDAAGNQSLCSSSLSYVEDSAAPVAPSALGTTPASPANNNDPRITGTAEAGSTVNVYATNDCTGGSVASGTAAAFGGAGLNPPDIADNSTTSYTARATDAAGNQSGCSSSLSYVEDSAAPVAPSALGTTPASPANNNDPRITGTAEAGSTVNVYATNDCTGGSIASGTAATFGGAGLNPPDIADNTTTSYTARATDAAGNQSGCSSAVAYVEDSAAPVAPSTLGTTPASPANNNDPRITGTAEAGSTVNVYATNDCTGGSVASGTAAAFGGAGLNPPDIADNSTTSYTATAADAAGNTSPCSSATSYVEDSAAPVAPSALGTTPASPANNNDPRITGTAEAGSTVNVYATNDCTGGSIASGTAATFGGAGLNPPDIADNSTTSYTARATDTAGNQSVCSAAISYVEDSVAPGAPSSLSTTPASPANNNDPRITGTAEAGSTVNVYATNDCTGGSVASGTAAAFGGAGLNPADVADNSTTSYTARATDAAGNQSGCSSAVAYVEDSAAPSAPTALSTTPGSPANDNDPRITGTAEAGATVNVYATNDCTGGSVASGTAAAFGGAGLNPADVADNSTTSYTAAATDAAGNTSPCSSAISYVEDSAAPSAPSSLGSTPASPANNNDPRITGTAEAGSTVNVYATNDCTGGSVASGTAAAFGGAGLNPADVADNSTTSYTARATDAANNQSVCSSAVAYVEDSAAPVAPSALGTTPNSPANNNDPRITGTAEAGSTVNVYATNDCTGGSVASGTAAAFGGSGLNPADVADNTTTSYTVKATDPAGNQSGCSSAVAYVEDSAAPSAPSSLSTTPASPANNNDPRITGTAEAGSTVNVYATNDCTGGSVASGTAAAFGGAGFDPPNVADNTSTSYTAHATDAAGNQSACSSAAGYIEDSTNPSSTVTFPTSGGVYGNGSWSTPAGTASDTGGAGLLRVEVSIKRVSDNQYWNGTAFADGTENWRTATGTASWSLTFPSSNFPADDDYVFRVRAVDNASNTETATSYTVTLDNAPPNTSITAQPNDPTNATGASFSFTSSEGGSTFECRLDGSSWTACTSPKSYTGLTQGSYTFDVRATDGAGNTDASPASFAWTVDTTDPSATLAFPAVSGTYRAATWNDFSGTASDTGGAGLDKVEVSIKRVSDNQYWNGTAFADGSENWRTATGTASWSLTFAAGNFPADGDYVVRARATDLATNAQAPPASRTFTIDNTAPNTAIDASPADPSNVTGPSFTFSSTEGGSTFECQLDGGGWSSCSSPKSYSGLSQGSHTFQVRATDGAGNTDASPASFTWTIDTTDPSPAFTFPAAGGFYNLAGWSDFAGTASDSGGAALQNVELSIKRDSDDQYWDGTAFADGTENWRTATGTASWSLSFPGANFADEGAYTVRLRATDTADNVAAPATRSFSVDTTAPDTTITAQPSDPTNATGASFSFSADQGGSTFECQLDGGGWSSCGSPKSYSGLSDGSHTFQVRATDAAGNTDLSPASMTWTVDTAAPNTTITAQPSDPSNVTAPSFSLSSSEGGSTFECQLDGGGWTSCTSPKSYTGLSQGSHTFEVRATDAAGNTDATPASYTWTIDTAAPNTTITAQPSDPSNSADADFSFSSSEGGSTFECQLDGGGWSSCTSPKSYAGLSDGSHTSEVRATDAAGNTDATPASFTWTIDTAAPSSVVTFPSSGGIYGSAAWADIAGTASDGVALDKVEVSVKRVSDNQFWNGTAFADGTENWRLATGTASWSLAFPTANFPADDDYVVRVRATDTAANLETPNAYSLTYDTAAPNTTITAQPSDPTNATGASFSFSASEGGSTFECQLDGGGWSSCTSPKSYAGLSQGSHTFDVRATDAAANTDGTPATFTWAIDTAAPNTTITAQPSDPSNSADADFSFTSSEGGSTFECQLDSGGWSSCASPKSYTGLSDGSHTFEVRATDAAGNTDASPASFTWTVDAAAPETTITAQPSDPSNDDGPSFSFNSSEGGSTFECQLDGSGWSSCSSPKSYAGLTEGAHTFQVRATDASSNTDPTPASFTWTIDTSAPNSTITAQPSDPTNATGASFSFTSSEGGSTFECQRDSGGWSSCTSPKTYTGLADGSHTFEVRATDPAGNTDPTPASYTWTIDTAAPNTTITTQPSDPSTSAGANFSFSSSEGGSTFQCRIDGGAFAVCASPKSYTGLSDGSHTFQVRATDAAGNTDPTPASFTWTVDTAAPNTTITAQPSDPSGSADADFSFSSSEGGSTFECRIDGGSWSSCASPKSHTGLSDGSHTFEVRATDAAGNTDPTQSSFTWTIDTTAPNTTITAQPSDPSNSGSPDFTFSASEGGSTLECSLDAGAFVACASPKSYSGLSDGSHTFEVRATDAAGNTDPTPAGFTWTIDTAAPSSSTSFPVNIGSYNIVGWNAGCTPSGICGTASDAGSGLDRVEVSIQRSADSLYWNGSSFASASEDWQNAGGASWNLGFAAAAFPADGSYTIRVRARDLAGNVEAPASRTFTIDTTPPDTSIDSGPANPTNGQDPSFAFSGGPGGVSFECRLDAGSWSACVSPKGYTGLAAGSHTFEARAQDGAGNDDPTPAARTWTIDLTAPSSAIAFPANGGSYNGAGWNNPSGTASDGVGLDRVEISLRRVADSLYWNGTAFADGSENWRTATGTATWSLAFAGTNFPADGDYSIRVRAVDAAGNVEAPSSRTFNVDTVPPQTTIDTAPATPDSNADASFTYSADQPGSTFECRIDGGAWAACTSPRNYTSLGEGSHTFEVRASDIGGNVDPSPASHTWVVDTVPPVATMDDPGQYLKGTVNLNSTSTDTGGSGVASVGFERSPAGAGTWTSIAAAWDTTGVANALYDLRVIATDFAGNSSSTPALTGRWVDNLKPTVSMVDPGPVSGTVTVEANAADAHSGVKQVELQVFDGVAWVSLGTDTSAPYQASWATATFVDGPHDLRAIATDYTDNVETSSVVSVIVDNTDPTVDFTTPVDLGFVNGADADPFTLVADAADLGSGVDDVEFFLCTAGGVACTSSSSLGTDIAGPYEAAWSLPGADGVYHLKATARDLAGRSASVVVEVTVDRTTPDTTLVTSPGDPSRDSTPDFTFSSSEAGSTFECSVDGGAWAACSTPHTTAPLADGPRTFDVRAIDAAGNTDATPSNWAWLLDTTPPTAAMNDPGANLRLTIALTSVESDPGASPSGIASVEYQYSVADANTWVTAPAAWDTTTVSDGLYDLRVVVTDNAGNETQAAAVEDRRIDNSPPATAIDDPGANLRALVAITGTASDTGSGVANVVFEVSPDGASWSTIGADNSDPFGTSFDTASLPDGLYFFRTVASDVAGNVTEGAPVGPRRIDNTPPTASLNDPGANLRGAVNLSSVVDDPPGPPVASGVSVVMYEALIGGVWTGISQTWATTSVPDGVYDLRVVVADVAGNTTTSGVVSGRRVDNTPPNTSHNAPAGWQSGATTVALSPSDGGSGVANTQYSVDGGGWNSGTSVNVSGDGIHTISFFSTDVAGNIESAKTATVMIDSTPPDPGANDPGNYLRGTVTLTASPNTGGPGGADVTQVEFQHKRTSDSTWTSLGVDTTDPYSATWATTPADDGSWDLRFIVTDEAANTNTTDLASKIVDNTAPTGNVASPLSGSTISGSITLGVSASDDNPIAGVEYFVNGSSIGTAGSAPFQMSWNSASGGDGGATISAVISDVAGNSTSTGSVSITVDNFAPGVSLSAPAANVSGTISLGASADGDTVQVTFERRPAGGGGWTTIGTAVGGPWSASFDTTAVADGNYELRAIAVDAGGNSGTSGVITTRVDNTDPSGLLTAPGGGATVGSSAVPLSATGSDGGSGVASITWQARVSGGGGFGDIASDSSAPFAATWDVTSLPSVAHDMRIVVTDLAGNTFTSPSITVNIDSTAPTVSLNNPGSPLSGTVALSASTAGDATTVVFSRSPAGAASWSTIGTDGSAPYGASFDTTAVPDGLYDLRAVVNDAVGNTSPDVIAGVRIDNFVPIVVTTSPGNGSIVATANVITITASEDIASVTGGTLDGAPSVMPMLSGAVATFNVGSLSDGAHTLEGTIHDAAGKSSSFSVTFMVGVPAPAPSTGGTFDPALPLVPTPSDFAAKLEADGSLTLRWKPSRDASGEPFATLLYVDGIATQTLAPGETQVNLGPFDPADMRVFTIVAVDGDGKASPASAGLRSTSVLAGKTLDEARAILANRGFAVGIVRGNGTIVVAPAAALMAPMGSKIDLELGTPTAPQARLVFDVVATKRYAPAASKSIALRLKTTRAATVTATLIDPHGKRAYRWRFLAKAGITIKRLTMPPSVKKTGRYRLVFSVESGRESAKKSIVVQIVKKTAKPVQAKRPLQIVLATTGNNGKEIERDLSKGMEVLPAAVGEDAWTLTGASSKNVEVIVVDVDRYGLQLIRDLRLVFPTVRILALTNDPRRLGQAVRAGATIAVPRSTPPKDLAKLIQRLANRRQY